MAKKTNVGQFYYTSSKRGYGVYAESADIKLDEKNQINVNIAYRRPQELIDKNEQNLDKYPVNVTRFKISNQKWVLARSNYLGKDNTGRDGNFFSHVLLFENVDAISKNYLQYPFRQSLTEQELETTNPAGLPFASEPEFDSAAIYEFAKSNAKQLPKLIESYLVSLKENKKLAIVDSNENVYKWILVIHEVLPSSLTKDIEFATYVDRITSGFNIIGVYNNKILRDNSRLITFGYNDSAIDVSQISQSLANDYLNNDKKGFFFIVANSYKREELLPRLPQLYESLGKSEFSKDSFLKEIRPLTASNVDLSKEILRFLAKSKILRSFEAADFGIVDQFVQSVATSSEYYEFLYNAISQGQFDRVEYLFGKNRQNHQSIASDLVTKTSNDYTNYFIVMSQIEQLQSNFNFNGLSTTAERLESLKQINPEKSHDSLVRLFKVVMNSLNPKERRDLENYERLNKIISPLWRNVEEERQQLKKLLKETFHSSQLQRSTVMNLIYFALVSNYTKLLGDEVSDLGDSSNNRQQYLDILDLFYSSISILDYPPGQQNSYFQVLSFAFLGEFERKSHYGQKKYYSDYQRAFRDVPRYKPNFVLYFSLILLALVSLGGTGFYIHLQQPVLEIALPESEASKYYWYDSEYINEVIYSIDEQSELDEKEYVDIFKSYMSVDGYTLASYFTSSRATDERYYVITFISKSDETSTLRYYVPIVELEDEFGESENSMNPVISINNQVTDMLTYEFKQVTNSNVLLKLREHIGPVSTTDDLLTKIDSTPILRRLYSNLAQDNEIIANQGTIMGYKPLLRGFNTFHFVGNEEFLSPGSYKLELLMYDWAGNRSNSINFDLIIEDEDFLIDRNNNVITNEETLKFYDEAFPRLSGLQPNLSEAWMNQVLNQYLFQEYSENIQDFEYDGELVNFRIGESRFNLETQDLDLSYDLSLSMLQIDFEQTDLSEVNYFDEIKNEIDNVLLQDIESYYREVLDGLEGYSSVVEDLQSSEFYRVDYSNINDLFVTESGLNILPETYTAEIIIIDELFIDSEPVSIEVTIIIRESAIEEVPEELTPPENPLVPPSV